MKFVIFFVCCPLGLVEFVTFLCGVFELVEFADIELCHAVAKDENITRS